MSGLKKSLKCAGAIVFGMVAVYESQGARAYLPSVGLPPLRFQAVTTNHLVFDLKSFATAPKPAEITNAPTHQITAAAARAADVVAVSNPISSSLENTNQAPVAPQSGTDAKDNSETPGISPISSSSASDLLTVTPQMITEYLKPVQNQAQPTNQAGTVVFVPTDMQFAPPAPKEPGESQATYKTP